MLWSMKYVCHVGSALKNHKKISHLLQQTKSSEQAKSWKLSFFWLVSHHSPPIFYPPQNHHHQAWHQLVWKPHQPSYLQPSYQQTYQPNNLKSRKMNLLFPVLEFFNMSQTLVGLQMLCMIDANDSVPMSQFSFYFISIFRGWGLVSWQKVEGECKKSSSRHSYKITAPGIFCPKNTWKFCQQI